MRKFEIVNEKELDKLDSKEIILPQRQTKNSCGYDFFSPYDVLLKKGEITKIYTGVKALMNDNDFLLIAIRSSKAIKEGIVLANQVGIIDADYYGNQDNDGHIIIALKNTNNTDYLLKKNERFAQGIFLNYFLTDDDESVEKIRKGGIGSTKILAKK